MPYFLAVVRMRNGFGPHPDNIELRVRLHIEDPNNNLDPAYLRQSAQNFFEAGYLSPLLTILAPTNAEVLSFELQPAGPPDDYTTAPDDNVE